MASGTVRFSHPPEDGSDGVELFDHLEDVATRAERVVPADARTPAGDPLRAVVRTLAYVHDFGKATRFFQQYLGVLDGEPEQDRYRYHAPIGSFAAYHALDVQGFDAETCLAGFVAVAKHHGRLPDVAEYVHERSHRRENLSAREQNGAERQQTAIGLQIRDIGDHVPELAERVFRNATGGRGGWDGFRSGFTGLLEEIEASVESTGGGFDRERLSEDCYGLVLQCWGALVLADKTGAASARPSGVRPTAATSKASPSRSNPSPSSTSTPRTVPATTRSLSAATDIAVHRSTTPACPTRPPASEARAIPRSQATYAARVRNCSPNSRRSSAASSASLPSLSPAGSDRLQRALVGFECLLYVFPCVGVTDEL